MTIRRCVIRSCELPEQDRLEGRQACERCTEGVRRHLREIEAYLPMVALMPAQLRIPGKGEGRRSPGFGSQPPPGVMDALTLLDERVDVAGEGDGEQSVLWRLDSVCRLVLEERTDAGDAKRNEGWEPTIIGTIGYLLWTMEWCAYQPWVDDHAKGIAQIRSRVRANGHDRPPGKLANCLLVTCGGAVFWTKDVPDPTDPAGERTLDAARCAQCGRVYFGTDLWRLTAQEDS